MNEQKLLNFKDWQKVNYKTIRKFFLSQQDVEDIYSDYCESFVRLGYERRCDHIITDYLRKSSGRKGTCSYTSRKDFVPIENADTLVKSREYENDGKGSSGFDLELGNFHFKNRIKHLTKKDRAIIILIYEWGMSEVEVGNIFGVSGSRISQEHQRIQKRLSTKVKAEMQKETKRVLQEVLPEKTEGIFRRVEQDETKAVETIESWKMESFTEESF